MMKNEISSGNLQDSFLILLLHLCCSALTAVTVYFHRAPVSQTVWVGMMSPPC